MRYVAMTRLSSTRRPDVMVDLSAAMDDVEGPIYWDGGHTNERGAQVVADAMVDNLEPTLRDLVAAAQ